MNGLAHSSRERIMYIKNIRGKSSRLHKFQIPVRLAANAVCYLEGKADLNVAKAIEAGFIIEVEPVFGRNQEILSFQQMPIEEEGTSAE